MGSTVVWPLWLEECGGILSSTPSWAFYIAVLRATVSGLPSGLPLGAAWRYWIKLSGKFKGLQVSHFYSTRQTGNIQTMLLFVPSSLVLRESLRKVSLQQSRGALQCRAGLQGHWPGPESLCCLCPAVWPQADPQEWGPFPSGTWG